MADIDRAGLIDMVLRHLGLLGAAETASAEDVDLVGKAADSAYDRLNKFDLVPFPIEMIPSWAQTPLRDYVAIDVSPSYRIPVDRLADGTSPIQTQAKSELYAQVAGYKHHKPVRATYY